jgi:hypothetical protein
MQLMTEKHGAKEQTELILSILEHPSLLVISMVLRHRIISSLIFKVEFF